MRKASRRSAIATAVADVPLAARDDLERAGAALVELHRVGDRPGFAVQLARRLQRRDRGSLRLLDGAPGERGVGLTGGVGVEPRWRRREKAAVTADHAARRQVELSPPRDVSGVAERAHHGDAGALVGLRQRVGDHRHLDAEQRCAHHGAEQRLVALVVGMGDQRDAADDQLGPRGVDEHVAVGAVEGDEVVGAGTLAILDLRLGDGGAVVDVPHRRCLGAVGLAAGEVVEERRLAGAAAALVDRGVQRRPVEGHAETPEQLLERGLVDCGQLAGTAR